MATVALPGGVVSLSAENTDRLLALGQGDGALLYLALLRCAGELPQAQRTLGWTQGRLDAAYAALQGAALVGPAPAKPETLKEDGPPEYMTQDVVNAMEGDKTFAALQRQVELELGSKMSYSDLKTLYTIYDYLALPAEVICMLTGWCVEETERKYGPGRRPRMPQVKKEAYRWRDKGVDTLSAAEEFLQSQKGLTQRERTLLPLLGVQGRPVQDKEREYIAAWVDWGFSDEVIAMAYERTLMNKGSLSWSYMNGILKRWHAKGLHTPKEIDAEGCAHAAGSATRGKAPVGAENARTDRTVRNIAALKRTARKGDG